MVFKEIINNLYLGNQFANKNNVIKQLKVGSNFYEIVNKKNEDNLLLKNDKFVLTEDVLALNLLDSHDPMDFDDIFFAAGAKFILTNLKKNEPVFVHCQMGVSRSPSVIFVFLVSQNIISHDNFNDALNEFLTKYYPYMKVNLGVYSYLKKHFPFTNVKRIIEQEWGEL